nr:reverse transcriptase domain-containing protein [Tanacetum cinerariifolium]
MKMNTTSYSGSGTLPGNTITNPKEELKGITTRSKTTYQGPTIRTTSSSLPLVVERETESIKVNGVTDDALRLYLFPHFLTHHATTWFDCLPMNSINTFEEMAKMFLRKYFPPSMVTKLINEIINFRQCPDESLFEAWEPLNAKMTKLNKNLMRVLQVNQQVKAVTPNCETCGGPHSFNDCPATVGQTQNVYKAGAYQGKRCHSPKHANNMTSLTNSNLELKNMFGQFVKMNTALSLGSKTLPVERETEATKDTVHPTNNGSTKYVQPLVVQTESLIVNSEPVVASIIEPVASP